MQQVGIITVNPKTLINVQYTECGGSPTPLTPHPQIININSGGKKVTLKILLCMPGDGLLAMAAQKHPWSEQDCVGCNVLFCGADQ